MMKAQGSSTTGDRSEPRKAIRAGDLSRDGRGRVRKAPAILHYGFRPFFFFGALYAGLAVPLWLWAYLTDHQIGRPFKDVDWHAHEMLFGYLGAVIAGFVLTATPNWTGRLPLSGSRLAALVGLWLAGRIGCSLVAEPWLAMAMDLAFPAALALAVWREVIAGSNWKNVPVASMITLFGLANGLDHLATAGIVGEAFGQRLALAVAALLIALIGGRIIPSFTRNWLVKAQSRQLPRPFGLPDKIALVATGIALSSWLLAAQAKGTGVVLLIAGGLVAMRMGRWVPLATISEPILFVLHVGYGWLAVALALLGSSILFAVPTTAAVHALTAGTIGTMTIAVMTRASLGHTGREIVADRYTILIYVLVTVGAVLRVAAPFAGDWYVGILISGGTLWGSGFLLFAARYMPILWQPRIG